MATERTTPRTFAGVIDLWPTRAALARMIHTDDLKCTPAMVHQWHLRNSIPDPYWMPVVEAAARCAFPGITYALMAGFDRG